MIQMEDQTKEIQVYSINPSLENLTRHLNFNFLVNVLQIIFTKDESFNASICKNTATLKSGLL